MKNLAIIPARGGSKRIQGKNIKHFLGKPIISYSIDIAIESGLFETVMVSTDSLKIAEIAKNCGALVPFLRSSSASDDNAPLADVIKEVHNEFTKRGVSFDNTCCILPTAPLILKDDLRQGLDLMLEEKFSSVRPIVVYSYPIQKAYKLKGSKVEFLYREDSMKRTQDFEQIYHDAGQFYWIDSDKGIRGENKGAFVIPETRVQDIDNELDWELAELKYNMIKQQ